MKKYSSKPIAEQYCAITVAIAAPAIPISKGIINSISSPMFKTTETPRNISGIAELPIPLKIFAKKL